MSQLLLRQLLLEKLLRLLLCLKSVANGGLLHSLSRELLHGWTHMLWRYIVWPLLMLLLLLLMMMMMLLLLLLHLLLLLPLNIVPQHCLELWLLSQLVELLRRQIGKLGREHRVNAGIANLLLR